MTNKWIYSLVIFVIPMLIIVGLIIYLIINISITEKTKDFCEGRGYDIPKRIDGHFNCCLKGNVKVINGSYEVVEDCIVGGTIEGLK